MADFPIVFSGLLDDITPGSGSPILAKLINNLEVKVGIDDSDVVTSLDYLIKNPASVDPGHQHSGLIHSISGSDLTYNGDIISVTVDTNAEGFGAPLFMAADGHMDTADADGVVTAPCVALALETGTGTKKVLLKGVIRQNVWNWTLGPGKVGLIYLSTAVGTLMQTTDFSEFGEDDVIQIVGFALTVDSMYFNPQYDFITKKV